MRLKMKPPHFFFLLGFLASCSYQPLKTSVTSTTTIQSIINEDDDSLMEELFDPNSPAQQNINPSTTMPLMPHTVKEMQYAARIKS